MHKFHSYHSYHARCNSMDNYHGTPQGLSKHYKTRPKILDNRCKRLRRHRTRWHNRHKRDFCGYSSHPPIHCHTRSCRQRKIRVQSSWLHMTTSATVHSACHSNPGRTSTFHLCRYHGYCSCDRVCPGPYYNLYGPILDHTRNYFLHHHCHSLPAQWHHDRTPLPRGRGNLYRHRGQSKAGFPHS